jgi:hypothetical protein
MESSIAIRSRKISRRSALLGHGCGAGRTASRHRGPFVD